MPKSLAEGHTKLIMLTTIPTDPEAPTTTELDAGVDISPDVLASAYSFSAADSDRMSERALDEDQNVNVIGASNYVADITLFQYFDGTSGILDATESASYVALKTKGTLVYLYERQSGQKSSDASASGDELFGMAVLTDNPQKPADMGGYIKRRIPMEPQNAWYATVAT